MKATKKKPLLQCEALHEFLLKAAKPVEFSEIVDMLNANKATEIKKTQASKSQYMMAAHRVIGRAMRQYSMTMTVHEHPESKVKRLYSAGDPPTVPNRHIEQLKKAISALIRDGYTLGADETNDQIWVMCANKPSFEIDLSKNQLV